MLRGDVNYLLLTALACKLLRADAWADDPQAALAELGATVKCEGNRSSKRLEVVAIRISSADNLGPNDDPFFAGNGPGRKPPVITEAHWRAVCSFRTLREIVIYNRACEGPPLELIGALQNLRRLEISYAGDLELDLRRLSEAKGLETLRLRGFRVTKGGLGGLGRLSNLERLDLSDNTGIGDEDLRHIGSLLALRALELSGTSITDAGLSHLGGLKRVQELDVSRARIAGTGLAHLGALANLRVLSLSGTPLTDAGVANLKGLRMLRELQLNMTQVSDGGLETIAQLRRLRRLDVAESRVTERGVKALEGRLPRCCVNASVTRFPDETLLPFEAADDR